MNPQHSAQTSEWHTPSDIIDRVHQVIGLPDLDPCSTHSANVLIKAAQVFTRHDDGLSQDWVRGSVFCNPPSRLAAEFWRKLMVMRAERRLQHAIFLAYSIEQLATTQRPEVPAMLHFPFVVPRRRFDFLKPDGLPGERPSHANAVIYVPGTVDVRDQFFTAFAPLGVAVQHAV